MATITCDVVDNKPARLDIAVPLNSKYPGDQFQIKLNGSPVDITNAIIRAEYRPDDKTGEPVAKEVTNGSGITISDGPNGVFISDPFTVDPAEFSAKIYWRDFVLTNVIDGPLIPVEGEFKVLQNVTQPQP